MTTGVAADRVGSIVDLLTVDLAACRDPCLTPIVPLSDGRCAPMSSLITPGAMVRNFTARLQLDPGRFGRAGHLLGRLGSRTVAETLRGRLEGALVDERVKVLRPDGSDAGDFDAVAYDPAARRVVVFEVLWRISLDGSADVADLEGRAHGKRDQVLRLQEAIAAGARPRWRPGWAVPDDVAFDWFILTPSVLPARVIPDAGVPVRSHQILASFRWPGKSVADMVDALQNPPPPPPELSATYWTTVRYGRYKVSVEALRAR
jgi:hypothetical protein